MPKEVNAVQFVRIDDVHCGHRCRISLHWLVIKKEGTIPSGEHITRDEIISLIYILTVHTSDKLANIPEEILLKDAFTSNAEFLAECIQARLCGVRLPTTIEDCHGGVINHCNFVAVEIHSRDAIISDDLSVTRRPILVCLNSGTHLLFDLTHVWCRLVDFYTIHEIGEGTTDAVPLVQLV